MHVGKMPSGVNGLDRRILVVNAPELMGVNLGAYTDNVHDKECHVAYVQPSTFHCFNLDNVYWFEAFFGFLGREAVGEGIIFSNLACGGGRHKILRSCP